MSNIIKSFLFFFLVCSAIACAQKGLTLTQPGSGLRLVVINKNFPLLKILLPGQPASERGIEVEFPEHVTGLKKLANTIEHLYLVTRGNLNNRTTPAWKAEGNTLIYETELNNNVKMVAKARLEPDGISYTYSFANHSAISYEDLQAVTCVKLYSVFSNTLLERTWAHHPDGFDLLAAETHERLTMPLEKWLPCRYLVSYTWPVAPTRIEKGEDSITRYHKSRRADKPFIATFSHDKKWIAATYTRETGNVWTNPERSCQHADPSLTLKPGESKSLQLKTFLVKGTLNELLSLTDNQPSKNKN
ncbi:MAG: hypothetical protein WDO71_00835 [Bacteroidota bacterium]